MFNVEYSEPINVIKNMGKWRYNMPIQKKVLQLLKIMMFNK